jgi:hypothetical protein
MVGPSLRCGPTEFKQIQILNEILDDNVVGEYSSDEENLDLYTPVSDCA